MSEAWYQGFQFDDASFAFELLRVMTKALEHGSDIGECLAAARAIGHGAPDQQTLRANWHKEWRALAERIEAKAMGCLARGHTVSARDAYFRANEYYRSADFYLHDNPADPAIMELWEGAHRCFEAARQLAEPPFEAVLIPYEGTTLPGYFCPAFANGRPAPTLVVMTGFDGTAEELYLEYALDAVRRGYNCLAFEGPGQGSVIRRQGLVFRHDWEAVVTPAIDHLLTRAEVDAGRIALMGVSMGGYLAPRAAAFEHRLAALVANGGVFDVFALDTQGSGMSREALLQAVREQPGEIDKGVRAAMARSQTAYWGVTNGMWVFGAATPSEAIARKAPFTLAEVAAGISCPTLVIDSEAEQFFAGQPRQLFDALTCPRTLLTFRRGEGAELHCQSAGRLLGNQEIFDWLDETLGG